MKRFEADTLVSEHASLTLAWPRTLDLERDVPDPVLTMPDPLTAGWHAQLTPAISPSSEPHAGQVVATRRVAGPPRAPGLTPRRRRVPWLVLALAHISGWAVWGVVIGLLQ